MTKKSYRSDFIRWGSIGLGILVFFVGPRFVVSYRADDIQETIEYVKKSKINKQVMAEVVYQLDKCKNFARQNADPVTIASVKLPAVYWLAFLIIAIGNLIPLVMKYFENKKAKAEP